MVKQKKVTAVPDEFSFEDEERPEDLFGNPFDGDEELPPGSEDLEEKEVKVAGVYEQHDQTGLQPSAFVVLLRDAIGRAVPIWIGRFEAMAISLALEGASADRPLPYDLLHNIITKMGATVDRILIDDLWNNTYYAKITITYDSKVLDADSRPSDAIALALRAKAPIYMAEAVLRKAAVREE
ncbi:MAG: bifunctional nuclease family protein [Armatimonadetes bacterium]|nr:bifunctional nuclease family protein [Armatimonadota bacterium]